MKSEENTGKALVASILSLSLLTVMAGAAVAPALSVIREYFADSSPVLVQMIISVLAIFIVINNAVFPKLCQKFGAKTLTIIGLLLYTVGGCIAGAFSQIVLVLIMRAFVGIGVGIIMPLSTGLLSFYFPPERQAKLMGYSSAMNQMGGVVATLLSGMLAGSACIGFANGVGIPFIIFEASVRAGKAAATTVMPLISAALYLAQFLCPILMSIVRMLFGSGVSHLPYCFAVVLAVFLCIWSVLIPSERATR